VQVEYYLDCGSVDGGSVDACALAANAASCAVAVAA
jgi:hypothetical protein